MSQVPEHFSVSPAHQVVDPEVLSEVEAFCRAFDAVTGRPAWREAVLQRMPEIARLPRREVCFFSAWDFHLPPQRPGDFQLVEFNDNGSGLLFAVLVNRLVFELADSRLQTSVAEPASPGAALDRILAAVEQEARDFFGERPRGLFLILDDAASREEGRFRDEQRILRRALETRGLGSGVGTPEELRWDGSRLSWKGRPVDFVVNRSTDFFFEGESMAPLRAAYGQGGVYVAPNPESYGTRSEKSLLEFLSASKRDDALGIRPEERALLARHVPETHLVTAENAAALAARKHELVFKPARGFASHGLLASEQVGRSRLERLLRKGERIVAQRRIPKRWIEAEGVRLWTDLRVWSWRGHRLALSGRASRRPDRLDLRPPGGWLATYSGREAPEKAER